MLLNFVADESDTTMISVVVRTKTRSTGLLFRTDQTSLTSM